MSGLAPYTLRVFEAASKLDCIKPYLLVIANIDIKLSMLNADYIQNCILK